MKKWMLLFVYGVWSFSGLCQQPKNYKNEFQLTVGLNSYMALDVEPTYSYMFLKYVGVVGGFKGTAEIVENLHYPLNGPDYQWRLTNRDEAVSLLFRTGLRLKIPILSDGVSFVCEPTALFNLIPNESLEFYYRNMHNILDLPYSGNSRTVKNTGGDVVFFSLKNHVSIEFDRYVAILGYDISTYDIYSSRRNIVIEGDALNDYLPSKTKFMHCGFIGLGYLF